MTTAAVAKTAIAADGLRVAGGAALVVWMRPAACGRNGTKAMARVSATAARQQQQQAVCAHFFGQLPCLHWYTAALWFQWV